ncbi:hypothetical protein M758_2G049800 [Ceratodon purpureus]|nr:hypothetical protein M758_2G049800 [Ceratodon purpureus]
MFTPITTFSFTILDYMEYCVNQKFFTGALCGDSLDLEDERDDGETMISGTLFLATHSTRHYSNLDVVGVSIIVGCMLLISNMNPLFVPAPSSLVVITSLC